METAFTDINTPAEKLAAHLKANHIPQEVFARRIGVSQGSLSKLCRGRFRPSLSTAAAIEHETEGTIPAASWALPPVEGAQ